MLSPFFCVSHLRTRISPSHFRLPVVLTYPTSRRIQRRTASRIATNTLVKLKKKNWAGIDVPTIVHGPDRARYRFDLYFLRRAGPVSHLMCMQARTHLTRRPSRIHCKIYGGRRKREICIVLQQTLCLVVPLRAIYMDRIRTSEPPARSPHSRTSPN